MLWYRQCAIDNKKPRRLTLQSDVSINAQDEAISVDLIEFENSIDGLIRSFVYHYQGSVEDVYAEWDKHRKSFRIQKN